MDNGLQIERWAFWSPEGRDPSEWLEHWRGSAAAARHAEIPADSIPAAHRRRMSGLSKLAVEVALRATDGARADFLVFCSQHGEVARARELLGNIARGIELSPTAFSQSVHNTAAGLYTIVTCNDAPATALASGASTFAYGWLEAEAFLAENPSARVLLVSYDEVLPPEYARYSSQRPCLYALGLTLAAARQGGIELRTVPSEASEASEPLPLAPLFIAWWRSTATALRISVDGRGWEWGR